MSTTTTEPVTIQQAFAQAKEEHSKEQAPPVEASTETTDPAATTQHTVPAAGASTDTAPPETSDLISDTDWDAIQKEFKGDPTKQRAELNKRWTQKTQALSEERKKAERLANYTAFADAYEEDAEAAVQALAAQHGLQIAKPADEKTTSTATAIADAAVAQVKEHLGPELDFLAEPLTRAMRGVAEAVAKAVAEQAVAPVKEQLQATTEKAAQEQTVATFEAFEKKHPEWKPHEDAMHKLSQQLTPGKGMSSLDYLEQLYRLVTFDDQIAKAGVKAVQRLAKGAEAAEREPHAVPDRQVTPAAPANATFRDAFNAAKRNERWE